MSKKTGTLNNRCRLISRVWKGRHQMIEVLEKHFLLLLHIADILHSTYTFSIFYNTRVEKYLHI